MSDDDLMVRLDAVKIGGVTFASALPALVRQYIDAGLSPNDIAEVTAMYNGHAMGNGAPCVSAVNDALQAFADIMTESARASFAATTGMQRATLQ